MLALRLAILLAALIGAADLLLLLPVGLGARYAAGVFSLTAQAGPVPVRLLPKKPARRDVKAADRDTKRVVRRVPGPVLRLGARCGLASARRLRGRIRLSRLRVHFTAGGEDPCRAAMAYARAGLALEGIARLCAGRVRQTDLRAAVDFGGPTVLDADVLVTCRLGYVLWTVICFCFAFLREYYRYKKTEG